MKFYELDYPQSSKWSLMFQFGQNKSNHNDNDNNPTIDNPETLYLSATHSEFLSYNDTHRVIDCPLINYDSFKMLQFRLPSMNKFRTYTQCRNVSMVYSRYNSILYMTTDFRNLYSLDLTKSDSMCGWNDNTKNLFYRRTNMSLCLVDKDRFIAILGGTDEDEYLFETSKYAELYAINCDKSVALKEMNYGYGHDAVSIYHNKFHKIIIAENERMEWHDINKDKWIVLSSNNGQDKGRIIDICVDDDNPNIVYITSFGRDGCGVRVYENDLRIKSGNSRIIESDEDISGLMSDQCILKL